MEQVLHRVSQLQESSFHKKSLSKFSLYKLILFLLLILPFYPSSVKAQTNFNDGPGGPILVVSTTSNPFSRYYVEILRAEGLNAFAAKDITQVTAADLNNYDAVILGEMSLSAANVTIFTNWVNAGGTLIAMRPDAQLAPLLGLTVVSGTLADKYMKVNTATQQGNGIVNQTIQYHGTANLYTLNGAISVANLYSNSVLATANPAVSIRDVGTSGGQAVAFAYDLARSVVYTRQGNPAWAGQERDGITPVRSDDQYFGDASFDPKPDYVDLDKVAIPQADEQQHLLTNIIIKGNSDKKPLPHFWFLPKGSKAAIVMTGDDHANGGTAGRFNQYKALSTSNTLAAVKNWDAIRSSSYLFPGAPLTNAQAIGFQTDSFDVSLHLNTNCIDYTAGNLPGYFTTQLQQLASQLPGIAAPTTHRTHCLLWSDWSSTPKVELSKGIRLDVNYYYWPGDEWLQNRSGMFTGSGMPMRYSDLDGTLINCYQVVTQMTDESDQTYPDFVESLLDKATGPEGYYGVFCANMHTDNVASTGSDAIINSAVNHNVPVVSAKQMLTWLDARNSSSFSSFAWSNNTLNFSISAASSALNLQAMLPTEIVGSQLSTITFNGSPLTFTRQTIKGIEYAFFAANSGNYSASYNGVACTPPTATLTAAATDCSAQTISLKLNSATGVSPYSVMVNGQTYSNVLVGQNFTAIPASFAEERIWGSTGTPQSPNLNDGQSIELGVKFRASVAGVITGLRFYKGAGNSGTHTGNLYTSTGTKLGTATFINETASGWQEVRFTTPIAVNANTTYIASYFSSAGGYATTNSFFATAGVTSGSLTALKAGTDGVNGLYRYGATGVPNQSYNSSNYWVDVIFKRTGDFIFNLTSVTDAIGCNRTGNISSDTVTQAELLSSSQTFYRDQDGDGYGNPSVTINGCTAPAGYITVAGDCNDNSAAIHPGAVEICDGVDNNCDGRIDEGCTYFYRDFDNDTYGDPNNKVAGATPPAGYIANNTDCNDSSSTVHPGVVEVCGNGIDDNCNGTIDEGCVVTTEQSIWGTTGTPGNANDYDGQTIEVGVKFRVTQAGTITGIRFYKGTGNTGTHTGNLWTSTGTKLATIIFTGETASGWQSMHFTTPVSINANTTYVASYFSTSGRYASSENFFTTTGVTNGPITALMAGTDGVNGLYKLGTTGFPTSSYGSSNYWVDVLFKSNTIIASSANFGSANALAEQQAGRLSVDVTPNPTSSYFNMLTHSAANDPIEVRVVDVVGRVVETKRGLTANSTIPIGHSYRPGVYFVQVMQGKEKVMVKLVKLSH